MHQLHIEDLIQFLENIYVKSRSAASDLFMQNEKQAIYTLGTINQKLNDVIYDLKESKMDKKIKKIEGTVKKSEKELKELEKMDKKQDKKLEKCDMKTKAKKK